MTLTEKNGRWLCKKSKKAVRWEDVTDIIKFDGDFCVLMGKAGRTEFHAYLHRSGNKWLQMHGVTSVLNYWGEKDRLIQWSVDQVCNAIEAGEPLENARKAHKKFLGDASDAGKSVHSEVEEYIKGCIENGPDFTMEGSEQLISFIQWAKGLRIEFLASERVVYSKRLHCAGTMDFLCRIDGKLMIGDVKTSNYIKTTHFLQMGAYAMFSEEMGEKIDGCIIVHMPRSGGLKTITNEQIGVGITELQKGFEDVVRLKKLDDNISLNLY